MSVSSVQQNPVTASLANAAPANKPVQKTPTDGDTPAIEAAESTATKAAEKAGGGFNKKG